MPNKSLRQRQIEEVQPLGVEAARVSPLYAITSNKYCWHKHVKEFYAEKEPK